MGDLTIGFNVENSAHLDDSLVLAPSANGESTEGAPASAMKTKASPPPSVAWDPIPLTPFELMWLLDERPGYPMTCGPT